MFSQGPIRINLDILLKQLICWYAFSIPFELVLEVLLGIDTIFKPFRLLSLSIIGVFAIRVMKNGIQINIRERSDWLLYLIFVYGIAISSIRIIGGVFNMGLFINDIFQSSLHLAVFFIFKNLSYNREEIRRLLWYFVIGISVNAFFTYYNFMLRIVVGRQSGFTDNPNYAALGLIAAMIFLLLKINFSRQFWNRLGYAVLVLFLLYLFTVTGSRTGLLMFVVALIFVFIFSPLRQKLVLSSIVGMIVLILLPQQLNQASIGGPLIMLRRVGRNLESNVEDVRFTIWRGVFRALEDVGYAGMGIGQFKAKFPRYFSEESNKLILEIVNRGYHLSTHNDFLAILTDYGWPSVVLYLLFLFFAMKRVIRRILYPSEDEEERLLAQLSFILLSCLIIFGLAAENFQHQLFWFLLMISTKSIDGGNP